MVYLCLLVVVSLLWLVSIPPRSVKVAMLLGFATQAVVFTIV